MSKEGFFGPAAFFHHRHPPTGWTDFTGPLQPRAYDLAKLTSPAASPWSAAEVLANAHCRIRYWRLDAGMARLARNADGDELLFVHAGGGHLYCDFGHLEIAKGDYVVLPRGTMWRIDCAAPLEALLVEATQFELHASGEGPGRQSRDLRPGPARHAESGCRIPGAAERLDALAGRGQATQRSCRSSPIRSIRSTPSAGTASSRWCASTCATSAR